MFPILLLLGLAGAAWLYHRSLSDEVVEINTAIGRLESWILLGEQGRTKFGETEVQHLYALTLDLGRPDLAERASLIQPVEDDGESRFHEVHYTYLATGQIDPFAIPYPEIDSEKER